VLYAQTPRHFGIDPDQDLVVPELDTWIQSRQTVNALLRQQQLLRVQQHMKNQADKHRTERNFQVGDQVWLKLQPYAQSSVPTRLNHKLSYRYFRPYAVEAKIGSIAYKLKLPPTSNVHPVFHVSLLKKVTGMTDIVPTPLPPEVPKLQIPEAALDRRVSTRSNHLHR